MPGLVFVKVQGFGIRSLRFRVNAFRVQGLGLRAFHFRFGEKAKYRQLLKFWRASFSKDSCGSG